MKALYYGDNLQVLRDSIATESVDLIYLDPPFNSSATYNVSLLGESGRLGLGTGSLLRGFRPFSLETLESVVRLACHLESLSQNRNGGGLWSRVSA